MEVSDARKLKGLERFGYRRRAALERKHKGAGRPQSSYCLIQIVAPYANLPCLTI